MNAIATRDLLISGLGDFGTALLVILGVAIIVMTAFFVFVAGYNSIVGNKWDW